MSLDDLRITLHNVVDEIVNIPAYPGQFPAAFLSPVTWNLIIKTREAHRATGGREDSKFIYFLEVEDGDHSWNKSIAAIREKRGLSIVQYTSPFNGNTYELFAMKTATAIPLIVDPSIPNGKIQPARIIITI